MIKKLKVFIPLLLVLSNTAYGYDELLKNNNSTENGRKLIYLKANVGAALLNDTEDSASKFKMRSKSVPYFAVGVGTYFMDNSRVDLTFEHAANPVLKKSGATSLTNAVTTNIGKFFMSDITNQAASIFSASNLAQLGFNAAGIPTVQLILQNALNLFENNTTANNFNDLINQAAVSNATQNGLSVATGQNNANQIIRGLKALNSNSNNQDIYNLLNQNFGSMSISTKVNHKATVNAFMVNGTLDLFEFDKIKFFAGAGIGGAQLKEKISITSTLNLGGRNTVIVDQSVSSKKTNNFAYSLTAGTSMKVTDKITFELAYAWKDFGKTKSIKIQNIEVGKTPYRSHTLTAGVRVDI